MRLGRMTERTPLPLVAIAAADLPAAEAQLVGTATCLGRATRPMEVVQRAGWTDREPQRHRKPS